MRLRNALDMRRSGDVFPALTGKRSKAFPHRAFDRQTLTLQYSTDVVVYWHTIYAGLYMTYMTKILAYSALVASLVLVFSVTSHAQDRAPAHRALTNVEADL